MNYEEFKSDPDRCERANVVLRDPFVVEMLRAVMESPLSKVAPLPMIGSNADDKAMALGHQYGFQFFHDRLIGLGKKLPAQQELEANYQPPTH